MERECKGGPYGEPGNPGDWGEETGDPRVMGSITGISAIGS